MNSKIWTFVGAALLSNTFLTAQSLPMQWQWDEESHRLTVGQVPGEGLYEDAVIHELALTFADANYWSEMTGNFGTEAMVEADLVINGAFFPSVGVGFKGQTSYLMVNGDKKSFDIKLDHFIPGQDLDGYQTLNLNNAFQDPSFLREFLYLKHIRQHIPAALSSFVHLTINGEDWGLYVNVQQMNKDYLEEWFLSNDGNHWRADSPEGFIGGGGGGPGGGGPGGPGGGGGPGWGDGTAALNYNGPDSTDYNEAYTLKSTNEPDPWARLIHSCDVLNNTPVDALEVLAADVLDLDRVMWFLACENAFGDDDSYIYKGKMDYYVYWDEVTGRMTPLEYDGNSVLVEESDDWGAFYHADDENYPLLHKLMQVPALRQRYLAHLRAVMASGLDLVASQAFLDEWAAFIDDAVASDPKKIYSYNNFVSEVDALQTHVTARRDALLSNAEVNVPSPMITNVTMLNSSGEAWGTVSSAAGVTVEAQALDASGSGLPAAMNLHWAMGLDGAFQLVEMVVVGSGFAADIPAQPAGTLVRFYVEAVGSDGTRSYEPEGAAHNVFAYPVEAEWFAGVSPVVLNEVLAKNSNGAMDEAGEFEDWIELHNPTMSDVDLSGWVLTDNPWNVTKWPLPDTTLMAGGYLMVWADEDGNQGPMHANFKLSAGGELVWLIGPDGLIRDASEHPELAEGAAWARMPNGSGPFVIQPPTFAASNATVEIAMRQAGQLSVAPNPVTASQSLSLTFPAVGKWDLAWWDAKGRQVWTHDLVLTSDQTSLPLPPSLSPGLYHLRATPSNGNPISISIAVQATN